MSESAKPPIDEPTNIGLQGQILALRLTVAALIAALPDNQQSKVRTALKMQMSAADQFNADFLPFTIGEEATHQMKKTFSLILDLTEKYEAIGHLPP